MAKIVFVNNLGTDFVLNTATSKIESNIDNTTLKRNASGKLVVDADAIGAGVSANAGNLLVAGSDGKPLLVAGSAEFVEAVQNAVGQAIIAGAGLTYDDAANAIRAAVGNMTVADTDTIDMSMTGTDAIISADLRIDPAAGNLLTKSAAGAMVNKSSVLSAVEQDTNVSGFDITGNVMTAKITVNGLDKTMQRNLEPVEDAFGTPMNMWLLK